MLDKATLAASGKTQLDRCLVSIPESAWQALRARVGSVARYAFAKQQILDRLRRLISKQQAGKPLISAESLASARLFLVQLLEQAISPRRTIQQLVPVIDRHDTLRAGSYTSRVARKAVAHLKLRELSASGAVLPVGAMLRREHSKLYKH